MSIILDPARPDLARPGGHVYAPSAMLYNTDHNPAYQPRFDSAQALNERQVQFEAALETAEMDRSVLASLRERAATGWPVSGDLAALVRAGATLPDPDADEDL